MHAITTYKTIDQSSASSEQLLLLLYERAIQDQYRAIEAFESGNDIEARDKLRRVREIFIALASALDHEHAPEMTSNLHDLYMWSIKELSNATRDKNCATIKATLNITETLYGAWQNVLNGAGA